ncbi:uncharacterized protein At5g49945-like [Apium graveolens]|uniref:Coiled-coil domain-containing protein 47 n=1 Tax=Apium graveolens TaxID=4045 RepID=A0A6L5B7R0_APIGR|nr:hypothetical protein AG4045_015455 [Apium graveolens]
MAKRSSSLLSLSSLFVPRSGDSLFYLIALLSLLSLLIHRLSLSSVSAAHFEGFDADEEDDVIESSLSDLPIRSHPPPFTTLTSLSDHESHHGPPISAVDSEIESPPSDPAASKPLQTSFEYWDEDEFEGLPEKTQMPSDVSEITEDATEVEKEEMKPKESVKRGLSYYTIEIICVAFLIMFLINYFTGKKENENIALAWATTFATKNSIFEKNFSLLGVGEGDDSPLLLKEGQNVFKFYASGRRFCQGLLATIELKSRHDLISRLYNMVVPCKDEISFEVYMNDDAMDNVIFAMAKKKAAKTMQKEERDLQRFANLVSQPSNRKWVVEELGVVSESKEVAGDLITEAVLEQVFGEKAFEKFGKGFISMHFSDQYPGSHKKILMFKFAIPDINHMTDMTRLVALVPYYIDLIGRYKLSSQARSKTEVARNKLAQEVYRELQYARQEELQRKKADRRKIMEEAEAKLNAEALRKKEAKERARQLKKSMPKVKMTRAH